MPKFKRTQKPNETTLLSKYFDSEYYDASGIGLKNFCNELVRKSVSSYRGTDSSIAPSRIATQLATRLKKKFSKLFSSESFHLERGIAGIGLFASKSLLIESRIPYLLGTLEKNIVGLDGFVSTCDSISPSSSPT
jgi:hypothetical protein